MATDNVTSIHPPRADQLREAAEHAHGRMLGVLGIVSALADNVDSNDYPDATLHETAGIIDSIAAELREALDGGGA